MRENISPHISHTKFRQSIPIMVGGAAVFVGAFFLTGELAPISNTNAERINVNIGDGAYYMNISADDLDIDIDATPSGVTESVQKDIVVSTNSGTGYKLYLSMNNNETNGNRLYYNGDKTNTNYIIPTSSSSLSTNSWGYSTDGTSFSAVPLQGNEAVIGQSATSPSSPVTHSVYYGFNVNNTLPFGSYSGVVTYTAVADAAASPTAHTSVANYLDDKSMADPAGGDTLVITTSLMTNMQNLGDITVSVGGTNCPVTGTSTASKFAEVSCTMPAKSAGSYAVAVTFAKFSKTYNTTISYYDSGLSFGAGMNKIRTMQGMTTAVCNSIPRPTAFQSDGATFNTDIPTGRLRDTRDANSYYVKKLADGNCWMDQNLNLDLGVASTTGNSTNTTMTLTSADTDLNTKSSWTPPYNTQLSYTANQWSQTGSDGAKSYSFKDTENTGGTHSAGTAGRFWNGGSSYTSTGEPRMHFGNFYNWPAATAESGTSSMADGEVANDSVCPKGWRLPQNVGTKSFDNLIRTVYGITTTTSFAQVIAEPLHFILAGNLYWGVNGVVGSGTGGAYWADTAASTLAGRYLYLASGVLGTQAGHDKGSGFPVRCVSR